MWRDCGLNLWKSNGSFVHGRLTVRAESLQASATWTQLWLLQTVQFRTICLIFWKNWSIKYHSKYAEVEHLTRLLFLFTSAAETYWMLQERGAWGGIYETIPQRLSMLFFNYDCCTGNICDVSEIRTKMHLSIPTISGAVSDALRCFVLCSNSASVMKKMWPNSKLSKLKTCACGDLSAETKMAATLTYDAVSLMTTRGHSWPFRRQYGRHSPSETHVLAWHLTFTCTYPCVCMHKYTESPKMKDYVTMALWKRAQSFDSSIFWSTEPLTINHWHLHTLADRTASGAIWGSVSCPRTLHQGGIYIILILVSWVF